MQALISFGYNYWFLGFSLVYLVFGVFLAYAIVDTHLPRIKNSLTASSQRLMQMAAFLGPDMLVDMGLDYRGHPRKKVLAARSLACLSACPAAWLACCAVPLRSLPDCGSAADCMWQAKGKNDEKSVAERLEEGELTEGVGCHRTAEGRVWRG